MIRESKDFFRVGKKGIDKIRYLTFSIQRSLQPNKKSNSDFLIKERPLSRSFFSKLRGKGSNLRPSGYEPDELPLLYLAMYWGAKVGLVRLVSK